ncbi:MAG: exodeoxyribonuclease V subunit gamma [Betaproteobacteria bacterium]
MLKPGFLAFHGNRSEQLAEVVTRWAQRNPLSPLEDEVILVQSNGMAEWIKMEQARMVGVCAATRVELPSRFLWRTYRQVLGAEAVPRESPLDKMPMVWRLMALLPQLVSEPHFAPINGFLKGDEPDRMMQLASKLADLFDQYQNYRADWLHLWAQGQDKLISASGAKAELPAEQRWQPQLWRAMLKTLTDVQLRSIRPELQQRMVSRLNDGSPLDAKVAQRIIVFGMSQMPLTTLEALAALSRHSQVILAIPNPCRYYWGDIMDGRELLNAQRRRQPLRNGVELSNLPLEHMHAHAHPLLAAWGRQGRDFVRQLDVFDDSEMAKKHFDLARIDMFDDAQEDHNTSLLHQVQNRIRDLAPLGDHPTVEIQPQDRSVIFHSAHSRVRELEVLHDQLLNLLAQKREGEVLNPRDIIVMVPDIEQMAPAIRAVFGQYRRTDPRFIPFDIADVSAKTDSPLIGAVDWLLRLPSQRCHMSDLVDLLEVVPIARRFGIDQAELPKLTQWMVGAGIRWGLNEAHRSELGLDACDNQNSAWFGLCRMLLGYANGAEPFDTPCTGLETIEPYAEVGGLEAELAGSLAQLLQSLMKWWTIARTSATPQAWASRCRELLADMFKCQTDHDKQAMRALEQGLVAWQDASEQSGFSLEVPLMVARAAWLDAVETPSLNRRFRAGGVTFCTLMPMRAIPFEVVCLLGMNDGDYPRRGARSDFDLMGMPGSTRPGDRSRRDDDRQLMLEALLSARQVFYVSWCGRSVRDNSHQPPSVLVSQFRDYLAAAWGDEVVQLRTTEHPLQPFSRQYFEEGSALFTHAREWRAAHRVPDTLKGERSAQATETPLATFVQDPNVPLTLGQLTRFLRNPVKAFFRQRLHVVFDENPDTDTDEERFSLDGLEQYGLLQELLATATAQSDEVRAQACIDKALAKLQRSGQLPFKALGEREQQALGKTLAAMLGAWCSEQAKFPGTAARTSIRVEAEDTVLEDWVDQLRSGEVAIMADGSSSREVAWFDMKPSKLLGRGKTRSARPEKLLDAWVRTLAIAASGISAQGIFMGRDGLVRIPPFPKEQADAMLKRLVQLWLDGMRSPLPLPFKTALAFVADQDAVSTYEGDFRLSAEVEEPCLSRMFPNYDALGADERFERLAQDIYGPLLQWAKHGVKVEGYAAAAHDEMATGDEESA